MSLASWICIILAVCGFVLFLYGANFYISSVGWVGLYLFLLGVITLLAFYVYGALTKNNPQNP